MKLLWLLLILNMHVHAEIISSARHPQKDFSQYEIQVLSEDKNNYSTPLRLAMRYGTAPLPATTSWSEKSLRTYFKNMRDERSEKWNKNPQFLRRNAWMFPDDGCFVRAAIGTRNIARQGGSLPGRVFAFGNLKAETANSRSGLVYWWYHVALVVQVNGNYFVLDPSIEPERPLDLEEWLNRMGVAKEIKVAICGSGASSPKERCDLISDGKESWALSTQQYYLTAEWNRLLNLRRVPENELGDAPPWTR